MTFNDLLDSVPRTQISVFGRSAPAFRTCGIVGWYVALAFVLCVGPLAGRSLFALAGASSVCALSFFGYAQLRKLVTGRETLVLLEHVWLAFALAAGLFALIGVDVLAHLDPVAVAMAFFLGLGRLGCAMAGCCHGHPSSLGLRYSSDAVREGFASYLSGVRLFPVQLFEAAGLAVLGFVLAVVLFLAPAGSAFSTFLLAYAIMRFGLEGARGDVRPHLLGLSQARWMAIAEVVFVFGLALTSKSGHAKEVQGGALSALVGFAFLVILTAVANRRDRKLLGKSHIEEARQVVAELLTKATADPQTSTTSQGVRIAASRLPSEGASTSPIHSVSFSLARSHNDAAMLHRVAREVYPAEYLLRVLPNSGPLVMVSVPPAEPATSTQSEAQHASPKAPPARQASNGKSQLRAYFAPPVEPH